MMASEENPEEARRWPEAMASLSEPEKQSLVEFMHAGTRARMDVEQAQRNGWFELWYQPKIDLRRKCLAGAEALARIRHPTLGMLLPADFIADMSDSAMARLTEHALIATLRSWSRFDDAGVNFHLAINIPVKALFMLPIAEIVDEHRPKPERWPGIILDVTEDQIVRDIEAAGEVAARLKASAIAIAIDDFGAGYSSFSSLRNLHFSELKLHESFVAGCATDPTNAAICQTAIDLAHRFSSFAVAEGIENAADLAALSVMGCDFGQGVLIAPPMPEQRLVELLKGKMNRPAEPSPRADHVPSGPARDVGRVA